MISVLKNLPACILALTLAASMHAQVMPDTTGIYGERKDSLDAAVNVASGNGNFLSKTKPVRTEVITAAGLCKMACCNLAESFENSASVTVGYSDAVTGARQIRLLGQSGIYTQMLDENRPVMRGLSAPFGLNYIPGQWLESIQIAKGVTSVINGVESMTGQINMEHRKPTDEKPLYVQASIMNDTKADLNVISSLQLDEQGKWSTVILGHVDGNFMEMDHNGDGFMDDPRQLQFSLANRWLYYDPSGMQVRFGIRALRDNRTGGQLSASNPYSSALKWQSNIVNDNFDAYLKIGVPLNDENTSNVAVVADYNFQRMDSNFGLTTYDAKEHSAFINLLYQNQDNDDHHFTLGLSDTYDFYDEAFKRLLMTMAVLPSGENCLTHLNDLGIFGEYTYHSGDVFSAIVGLRADLYSSHGMRFSPRLTMKWSPVESLVFRLNGGRGIRYSTPLIDNIGVLSTGKPISGLTGSDGNFVHPLEDSWTIGANATWYLGESQKTYLSADFFHTLFASQLLVDHQIASYGTSKPDYSDSICFYELGSLVGSNYSYTDNFQLDFSTEPLKGLTLTLTGRYTDARQTLRGQSDDIKPMTSRFKAVFNAQYATNLQKWIFDFTASLNGPCRVWDFMRDFSPIYKNGYTQTYPLLYAQVTKRFKGFDIYVGGENLTGYTQPDPIIGAENPWDSSFDASCVWGPLMGLRLYAGVRMTIWKKG